MSQTIATTDNLTITLKNDTHHALPENATYHVLLDHVTDEKMTDSLVLTTATKGMLMFYISVLLVVGVFGNGGVLYLSLRHSKWKTRLFWHVITLIFRL
jgi:hypothetical protein